MAGLARRAVGYILVPFIMADHRAGVTEGPGGVGMAVELGPHVSAPASSGPLPPQGGT